MFHVGNIPYRALPEGQVQCGACGAKMARVEAVPHAHRKHKALSLGVLAGQMGLPWTGTADVPRE